jgi:hypothetical protein
MNMLRSMPISLRFVIWFLLAPLVALGVSSFGYLLPAGAYKFYLSITLQVVCNLLLGWLFGLIRFRSGDEIGISVLVIILAVLMPAILIVLAIISTLFCGIDACGH